jgi:hypothetical protein
VQQFVTLTHSCAYVHEELVTEKAEQLATVAPSQLLVLTALPYRKK